MAQHHAKRTRSSSRAGWCRRSERQAQRTATGIEIGGIHRHAGTGHGVEDAVFIAFRPDLIGDVLDRRHEAILETNGASEDRANRHRQRANLCRRCIGPVTIGVLTTMSLFTKPGVYKAGIAGAPATNVWHALTGEQRVMMRPQEQMAEYAKASSHTKAAGLRDHLLLIHGMRDVVVL